MTEQSKGGQVLTPAEERALPGAHYSAGRRYSRISKAWIFAEDWNDREEVARLNEELTATAAERDRLRDQLRVTQQSANDATLRAQRLHDELSALQAEAARLRDLLCEARHYVNCAGIDCDNADVPALVKAIDAALAPAAERPPGAEGSLSAAKGEPVVTFTRCTFDGPPPAPHATWTDWAASKLYSNVLIRAHEFGAPLPAAKGEQEKCGTWNPDDGSMHPKANPAMYDAGQHRLNGGPYCYHVRDGKYCGAAKRWAGHGAAGFHDFVAEPATPERKP